MRFRLKRIPGVGYFPQVKLSFFSSWKTIDKEEVGYHLYDEGNTYHPTTYEGAIKVTEDYWQWVEDQDNKPIYINL